MHDTVNVLQFFGFCAPLASGARMGHKNIMVRGSIQERNFDTNMSDIPLKLQDENDKQVYKKETGLYVSS